MVHGMHGTDGQLGPSFAATFSGGIGRWSYTASFFFEEFTSRHAAGFFRLRCGSCVDFSMERPRPKILEVKTRPRIPRIPRTRADVMDKRYGPS